jgi:hypothetical protein
MLAFPASRFGRHMPAKLLINAKKQGRSRGRRMQAAIATLPCAIWIGTKRNAKIGLSRRYRPSAKGLSREHISKRQARRISPSA